MMGHTTSKITLAVALVVTTAAFAQSPLAGNWKFNPEKSKLTGDTIRFAPAGNELIRVTSGGMSYSFKLDGSATTTPMGNTAEWKKINDHTWQEVINKGSITLTTDTYKLAEDDKSINATFEGTKPNGDAFHDAATYTRVSGTKRFFGTWKSTKIDVSAPTGYAIKDNGDGTLTWTLPDIKATVTLKTDGTDAPATGPTVPDGLTLSLTKTGPRTFTLVERVKGKPIFKGTETVSADGKTLTEIGSSVGVNEPMTAVYNKV